MLTLILATPVALAAVALLVGVVALVWTGQWQGWLGRDDVWTIGVWPLPLVSLIAPLLAAAAWFVARSLGVAGAEGSVTAGLLYLGVYAIPWVALTVAAPRWLFPAWARARVAEPPSPAGAASAAGAAPNRGAVPAVYCPRGRGHGSLGRWVWRIDGVAGHVVVDGEVLRFRPARGTPDDAAAIRDLDDELDAEAVAQLGLEFGPDLHLQAPRGGWWTRRRVDVELSAVTNAAWTATRRAAGDGLLSLEVAERGVVHLWVSDVERVGAWLSGDVGTRGDADGFGALLD
ncbi:MAG: hypothetical protein EA388_15195 [Nitriliruptor sp.]|nr:MAG: hypothetical protein EA388_15195 [Nitriliruptor sp.]